MNEWSQLPNAAHIDRVIVSLKAHPDIWNASHNATLIAAWDAAWDAASDAARIAAWDAARNAIRDAAWEAAYEAAYDTAWSALLALVAYDDAAKYLIMPSEKLKTWASLSREPAAVLLLPAVIAVEQIRELEMV